MINMQSIRAIRPLTLILVGVGVFLVAAVAIAVYGPENAINSVLQVSLLVAGFLALSLTVGALAVVLRGHGLSEHEHAFALPKGTVRALLALGLLVALVGVGLLMFAELGSQGATLVHEKLSAPPANLPVGMYAVQESAGSWNVYSIRGDDAQEDLAKQLFTTLATAVASVIGFYFGSRAVSASPLDTTPGSAAPRADIEAMVAEARGAIEIARTNVSRVESALTQLRTRVAGETNLLLNAALEEEISAVSGFYGRATQLLRDGEAAAAQLADILKEAVPSLSEPKLQELLVRAREARKPLQKAIYAISMLARSASSSADRFS